MVKRLFFLWVALVVSVLAYGQPMDWGHKGYGPHRGRPDLRELPVSFSGNKGDSLNVRCVGRWPFGPAYAVAVQGDYAYLGSGGGIYILNISDPTSPTKVAQIATPGVVKGLFVNNSQLYVADYGAGLRIINVADPADPYEVSYYDTPGYAIGVYILGSYAYVADGDLRIINVDDPANPYEVGYYNTPGLACGVYLSGSYAYVADWQAGLRIINVADPAHPYEEGYYDTPGYASYDVYVMGSYAYVANADSGLRIINVADPANPYEVGFYGTPGEALSVYVSGSYAYVADLGAGLRIINVADPAHPYEEGYYDTPGTPDGVYVLGSYAYVADDEAGLRVINVADPANPYEEGYYDTPDRAFGVYVLGSYAYVADWWDGLRIINVADPANPHEVGYYDTPDCAHGVYVSGSYAYVADVYAGLRIIDVADPANPYEEGYYETQVYAVGVYVLDSYAYLTDYNVLRIINVADAANPYEVGYYRTPGHEQGVYVVGSYAYVADGDGGLIILQFYGEPGNIVGTVVDSYTEDPIEGALVEALQGGSIIGSDNTDPNGSYSIPDLPVGTYNVRASKNGYETKTENGREVTADHTTTVDFQLNKSPCDTLLFDNFSDGNDDGWDKLAGSWWVENGEYVTAFSGDHVWSVTARGDVNWTDYIFEVDLKGIAGVDKCVAFRSTDLDNHYGVNIRSDFAGSDQVLLTKNLNGTPSELQVVDYPSQSNTWYHLKVEVVGDNIKVSVDDNLLIDHTDTGTTLTQGRIALVGWTGEVGIDEVHYDNVLVGGVAPPASSYAPIFVFRSGEDWFPCDPFFNGVSPEDFNLPDQQSAYTSLSVTDKLSPPRAQVYCHGPYCHNQEWVYDYWAYYLYNDYRNHGLQIHDSDWERVVVFVDKSTQEVTKIACSAHGFANIYDKSVGGEPIENHQQVLVELGSHAMAPDINENGKLDDSDVTTKGRRLKLKQPVGNSLVPQGESGDHHYCVAPLCSDCESITDIETASEDCSWTNQCHCKGSVTVHTFRGSRFLCLGSGDQKGAFDELRCQINKRGGLPPTHPWNRRPGDSGVKFSYYHPWDMLNQQDRGSAWIRGKIGLPVKQPTECSVYHFGDGQGEFYFTDSLGNLTVPADSGFNELTVFAEDVAPFFQSFNFDTLQDTTLAGEDGIINLIHADSAFYIAVTAMEGPNPSIATSVEFYLEPDSLLFSSVTDTGGHCLFTCQCGNQYAVKATKDTVERWENGISGEPDSVVEISFDFPVGVQEPTHSQIVPTGVSLSQNYPNPFNPITEIRYALPRDSYVRLEVYNILGQRVATLVDGRLKAGYKRVAWDAIDFPSGIYFYRISAGDFTSTRKMVLLR